MWGEPLQQTHHNSTGSEIVNPSVTRVGKPLRPDSKVIICYVVDLTKYAKSYR